MTADYTYRLSTNTQWFWHNPFIPSIYIYLFQ